MKKLLLLLILSFFSIQGFAAGCPDGSEPVKSVSDEATLDQRINCYKEIAKYTYPRLKLQELWVSPLDNLAPTVIKLVAGTGTST